MKLKQGWLDVGFGSLMKVFDLTPNCFYDTSKIVLPHQRNHDETLNGATSDVYETTVRIMTHDYHILLVGLRQL